MDTAGNSPLFVSQIVCFVAGMEECGEGVTKKLHVMIMSSIIVINSYCFVVVAVGNLPIGLRAALITGIRCKCAADILLITSMTVESAVL